jgi:ubiquinone/menaquinone biosynthesis C-methylase UbiE
MTEITQYNEKIVDQHTQQAEGYARLTQGMVSNDRRVALRAIIGVTPDDTLLDVACGPGSISLDLAPHLERVTGLDITPAMLDQARAAQAARGIGNAEWVVGDAIALPFPDASFSIVSSGAAFHHFEEPARVLAEMARVCRPGGRVVVIDVTPDAGKGAAYDRMEKMRDPSHGHAHSVDELKALGAGLGLGDAVSETNFTGPMPYEAVLATSFPEDHSREELLDIMRHDAETGEDTLGFRAAIEGGETGGKVLVTYPMSMVCWTKP